MHFEMPAQSNTIALQITNGERDRQADSNDERSHREHEGDQDVHVGRIIS